MRKASEQRLQAIWRTVEQNPGIRPGKVAQTLGLPRSSVTRALPALDEAGMLLSEDRKGGLWAWGKKSNIGQCCTLGRVLCYNREKHNSDAERGQNVRFR